MSPIWSTAIRVIGGKTKMIRTISWRMSLDKTAARWGDPVMTTWQRLRVTGKISLQEDYRTTLLAKEDSDISNRRGQSPDIRLAKSVYFPSLTISRILFYKSVQPFEIVEWKQQQIIRCVWLLTFHFNPIVPGIDTQLRVPCKFYQENMKFGTRIRKDTRSISNNLRSRWGERW